MIDDDKILLLVFLSFIPVLWNKINLFTFLNSTRVGLIPPDYNYYFEMIKTECKQKDSRINPTLSIITWSPILWN